jgi:hypothetical protein
MKNIKLLITGLLTLTSLLYSCEAGFDDLNTNKVDPTTISPPFQMNKAMIDLNFTDGIGTLAHLSYTFPIVQQIVTPFGQSLAGGNFNQLQTGNAERIWVNHYRNVVKNIVDAVENTRGSTQFANLHQAARIWKAYTFMILTDTYGDIPYSEAGKGYLEEIISPKYDPQEEIYKDILKELEEATAALDPSKPRVVTEAMYGGDATKWRRFGYSLMLRAGMRMSKVNPALAESYVKKAVAGGLMQSNADNAITRHTGLYLNHLADHLGAREKANYYLAAPFLDYLKNNNDPRLKVIAIRFVGAKSGSEQVNSRATIDTDKQLGMPMGYDNVTISQVLQPLGAASLWDFSQVNINTLLDRTSAPHFHVTHAQNQLYLAEAAVRGWVQGDAATYFSNGIRAHMEHFASYGKPGAIIPESAIQAYIQANPLEVSNPTKALEQINTQYWVASFLNGSEAFANFRRSGYPALEPNPFPGKDIAGSFIRRLPYPDSEIVINQGSVNDAVKRQGPNNMDTRVWWDKQ